MARFNFPGSFTEWFDLFKKIKAKHDADGVNSVLIPYFTEQGIVITDDDTDMDAAMAVHILFLQFEKEGEKKYELRNKLWKVVWKNHKDAVQSLKKLKRGKVHELGDWGIVVNGNKIVHPVEFPEQKIQVINFLDYHDSLNPNSPLNGFLTANPDIDFTVDRTNAGLAETAHDDGVAANISKEEKREERDNLADPVIDHIEGTGQFVVGLFPNAPHQAGDWGFIIDDSPRGTKIRTVKLNALQEKRIYDATLFSILENNGPVSVSIWPGDHTDLAPITIPPNGRFLIIRGFGTFTIKNDSDTEKAIMKVEVRK